MKNIVFLYKLVTHICLVESLTTRSVYTRVYGFDYKEIADLTLVFSKKSNYI